MKKARTFAGTELSLNMDAVREDAKRIREENAKEEQSWPGLGGRPCLGDLVHYNSKSGRPQRMVVDKLYKAACQGPKLCKDGSPMYVRVTVMARDVTSRECLHPIHPVGMGKSVNFSEPYGQGNEKTKRMIENNTLQGWADIILNGKSKPKVYVASGATHGEFDAEMDDPSLRDGGLLGLAAPQFIVVSASAGLALKAGIKAIMDQLREDDYHPDTGEKYLPGANPLDQTRWVDAGGRPYDESCPLKQDLHDKRYLSEGHPLIGQPMGRAHYEVFLEDPKDPEEAWACVVVQEEELNV